MKWAGWSVCCCLQSVAQIFIRGGCWVLSLRLNQFGLPSRARRREVCAQPAPALFPERKKRKQVEIFHSYCREISERQIVQIQEGLPPFCSQIPPPPYHSHFFFKFKLLPDVNEHLLCVSHFLFQEISQFFVSWKLDTKSDKDSCRASLDDVILFYLNTKGWPTSKEMVLGTYSWPFPRSKYLFCCDLFRNIIRIFFFVVLFDSPITVFLG